MNDRVLNADGAALLVVDVQEAFLRSIPGLERVVARTVTAVRGFEVLDRPVLITEQYPKGLGHTVDEIKNATATAKFFEKSRFSACGADGLLGDLKDRNISSVAIAGVETHVCVNQTVNDLLDHGFRVHILEDAVSSRSDSDRETALKKMYSAGAVPSTVEMALFEMLNDSASIHFKQIQSLIK